jgi:hypothetical protein
MLANTTNQSSGVERRIIPRYSFSYLTFKLLHHGEMVKAMTFEVNDVSTEGLALETKFFDLQNFKVGDFLHGVLNWAGERLDIKATIKWVSHGRMGLQFRPDKSLFERIKELSSLQMLTSKLKALHAPKYKLNLADDLFYWIQSEGPLEFFAWKKSESSPVHRLQIVYWQNYLEWEKGEGWSSGILKDRRHFGTAGIDTSECLVMFDSILDQKKLKTVKEIISLFPEEMFLKADYEFFLRKLMLSF